MSIHPVLQTASGTQRKLASSAKARRLELNITQAELAERSGVSLGSLRRFESTGEISLRSLLELALVLGELKEFSTLIHPLQTVSLFEEAPRPCQRSRKKSQSKEQE
ncbi:helix-turn-helix domain-containing protein [Mailhella sp.]|uniref:helix-turn-helix domain-containing protein n=1 Tax=Mailhella sp. TaxID=1981029 RepID=UPI004063F04E